MKRFLCLVALILAPAALVAAGPADRDVLLTASGTLYTVESVASSNGSGTWLTVGIDNGKTSTETLVPESMSTGYHVNPALAYDTDSDTLFVFWLKMPNLMSSELLLATYHDGKWSPAFSIDNKAFRLRYNLGIGVTRRVAQKKDDGSEADIAALIVHVVWWEQTGDSDTARYAMIAVDDGKVGTLELHDLAEFGPLPATPYVVDPGFNKNILKHPALLENGTRNSVDVLFGDLKTNSLNRVTVKPIYAQSRIHIPIGRGGGGGGHHMGAPMSFSADWSGRVSAMSVSDGKILMYNATQDAVSYLMYANGKWSDVKSIAVTNKLTGDAAVSALGRMMNAQ